MRLFFAVLGVLALVWTSAQVLLSWRRPVLGLRDGMLLPCGPRPNCVCSQSDQAPFAIAPFRCEGNAHEAFETLRQIVSSQSGTKLIAEADGYMRFECTTPLMRYVDDLEFVLDAPRSVIEVRSASRVGYSDMGTNRKRVESIRERFAAIQSGATRDHDVR